MLEKASLVAPSYVVEPDRMLLLARLAACPSWLPWIVGGASATIAIGAYAPTHLLAELELRVHAQAWMLRRAVAT